MKLSFLVFNLLLTSESHLYRRVIDGKSTPTPSWMVHLRARNYICGGVLYTESLVLTAAHCNKFSVKKWKAYVNVKRVEPVIMGGEQYSIIKRINHEKFVNNRFTYDISVWWINGKSNQFTQVELDDGTEMAHGNEQVRILGWGNEKRLSDNQIKTKNYDLRFPGMLQEAILPLEESSKCFRKFPNHFVPKVMFCIGHGILGPGTSLGDSGGPIFRLKQTKIILMGLINFGLFRLRRDVYDIGIKISDNDVSDFIKYYVPFFKPGNVNENGNSSFEVPPRL